MRAALLAAVRFYRRAVSPVLPPRCRFVPTCSEYAVEALEVHGAARGSLLALLRLLKCAPWHPGGVDLVPPARPPRIPPTRRSGTAHRDHSSCTSGTHPLPAGPRGAATPPAPARAPQEESSVA